MANEADRYNTGKPRFDLLPWDALEQVCAVYNYGCVKYSARNWEKGLKWNEGTGASLQRHYAKWASGEDVDPESGLHHDLHMAFNILAIIAYRLREAGEDDRPK